jgi:hypothetical protein
MATYIDISILLWYTSRQNSSMHDTMRLERSNTTHGTIGSADHVVFERFLLLKGE